MRTVLLASFGALLALEAVGANTNVVCNTEQSLGIAGTGSSQSLQYTTQSCIEDICTTGIKTRDKSRPFTRQCGSNALTITYVNSASLPDVGQCVDCFNTIIKQCIATDNVRGGTVSSYDAIYTVSTLEADKSKSREKDWPAKDEEELALSVQHNTALDARQLKTLSKPSVLLAAKSTQSANKFDRPTTVAAKPTISPIASAGKSTKLATQSLKPATLSSAITAKPSKSPSKCKAHKGELGTCKAKRFITKRTSTLAEIYKTIPTTNKVTTGNVKSFTIDNTKEAAFGATQCIGCSAFVAINGQQLIMGHFAEEAGNPPTITIESGPATQKRIIEEMEKETDCFVESTNAHAWFIHSSNTRTPAGAVLWKEYMQESLCIPENQVQILNYYPIRVIDGGLEELPKGKVVVTVTPQANGEAIVTLYSNTDTPKWSQRYDARGNPC